MESTTDLVVEERPNNSIEHATVPMPADIAALHLNRIRFDGFFTGPAW
jgi:hypothetical protein